MYHICKHMKIDLKKMISVTRAVEVMLAVCQFISFSSTARPTVFLHIIKLQLKDFQTVSNPHNVCCPFGLLFHRPQKVFWSLWRRTSTRWRGRNRE